MPHAWVNAVVPVRGNYDQSPLKNNIHDVHRVLSVLVSFVIFSTSEYFIDLNT